jgi:hypothetical protein
MTTPATTDNSSGGEQNLEQHQLQQPELRVKFLTDPVKQRSTRAIRICQSMIAIKMLSNLLPSVRMTNQTNHLHVL